MNRTIFRCLLASTIIMLGLSSCLEEENTETSPLCGIQSFSVGSIKSMVTVKKYDAQGNARDTLVARTMSGSDIFFNIDQVNGRIATVDSLPNWIDLTRVVPTVNCYGSLFRWIEEDKVYIPVKSGTDSIDFSIPVELLCVATDGVSFKRYTVEMTKASQSIDTLEWAALGKTMPLLSADKVVSNGSTVMAFGAGADGKLACSSTTDGMAWGTMQKLNAEYIDAQSIVLFKGEYYALELDGTILKSANGREWSVASQQKAVRLLCADDLYIYIYTGDAVLGSADLTTWTVQGTSDLQMLPDACISSASYLSRTNKDITVSVMTGLNTSGTPKAVAWYKMSCADDNVNQPWAYINANSNNDYVIPDLSNLSMTRYGSTLYLIGTKDGTYDRMYRSVDNGITWQVMARKYPLPADLDASAGGRASIITVGEEMWIVQQDGSVWTGSMR